VKHFITSLKVTPAVACIWILAAISMASFPGDRLGAQTDPIGAWLDHGRGCLDGVFSLEADFTQETIHVLGGDMEVMEGTVQLRRGSRIRLEYTKPERMLVVSDGKIVRAWRPETRTVIEGSSRKDMVALAFGFVLGEQETEAFDTRFVGGDAEPMEGSRGVVELVPHTPIPLVERILLTMEGTCPSVSRVVLIDRAGTATRFTLTNVKTNTGIGHKRFIFKPPRGAKIIRP
jgi:outer membrane lipoprotein-sorting protein